MSLLFYYWTSITEFESPSKIFDWKIYLYSLFVNSFNLHRGPFFAEWVQFLVDELNRVGKNREDLTELQQRWNQAVALELAFFDIGYDA